MYVKIMDDLVQFYLNIKYYIVHQSYWGERQLSLTPSHPQQVAFNGLWRIVSLLVLVGKEELWNIWNVCG